MTTVDELLALVEASAPAEAAEAWDNVGLLVGDGRAPVQKVWMALEVTGPLVEQAARAGADAIVTHHPVIFGSLKRVTSQDPTGAIVLALARHGIAVISAHTNLDAAQGGVNDCLARALGLLQIGLLPGFACGRTGLLPKGMTAAAAAGYVARRLSAARVRWGGEQQAPLRRVALVSGAGGDGLPYAQAWGAELFVTGELKYHEALEARERGLCFAEAGHDDTERVVLSPWMRHLQTKADGLQLKIDFSLAPVTTSPYGGGFGAEDIGKG